MVTCYHSFCWACINVITFNTYTLNLLLLRSIENFQDHTDRLANSVPCASCMAPITSLWPCPGQGVELVTPHNHGPRPTGLTAVGGGLMRTPLAPASATRTEEGEGSAETRLTPPSPTRSPRRSPLISPAPAALMRRSRRAAAVDANLQMQREYI